MTFSYNGANGEVYHNRAEAVKGATQTLERHADLDRVYVCYLYGANADCVWFVVGRRGTSADGLCNFQEVDA